jgi:UDP-3-O-acyl-N-acetylglucosamine deacetylase
MSKVIPINTSEELIFKQYLTIINGVLSSEKRLTNIEIDILEKLLYIDNLYKHLDKEKRDKILFHKTTRQKIREEVYNISTQSFNNVLTKLRKKGMIEGNSLKVRVPIKDNKIELTFKLEIKE